MKSTVIALAGTCLLLGACSGDPYVDKRTAGGAAIGGVAGAVIGNNTGLGTAGGAAIGAVAGGVIGHETARHNDSVNHRQYYDSRSGRYYYYDPRSGYYYWENGDRRY
jgi:uncharacterized protein YcfJ